MRNARQRTKTREQSQLGLLISISASLLFAALLLCGCEEEMQDSNGKPTLQKLEDAKDVNDMRPVALQIVQNGLIADNAIIRSNAIEIVVETRQTRLIPRVQRLLKDEVVPVRFAAVLALGDLEYTFGLASVEQMLRDRDPNVRIAASFAVARLGRHEYAEVLHKAISSSDQTVRANAALLLGKLGDRSVLKDLYWVLTDKKSDDKVAFQATESIARLQDERIYPKLWTMLISAYADVRVMGVLSMGLLGTKDAKDALVGMLDDEVLEVRLAAAGELGKLGDNVGEPEVLAVLKEDVLGQLGRGERERVAMLTALAIGQIRTPALTSYLPELLQDESQLVRIAAARAVLQSDAR